MSKLELCPHCGCEAWFSLDPRCFSEKGRPTAGYRIECQGMCHAMTCWWHTAQEAIDHWNERSIESALRARIDELEKTLAQVTSR